VLGARDSVGTVASACADCGCVVERGVRLRACGIPECCCGELPTSAVLDAMAGQVRAAFASGDLAAFGSLLADDARWGDADAPNACHSRADVVSTFESLVAAGVSGAVVETKTGRSGILCRLRIQWPETSPGRGRSEVFHLYRVCDGRIVEIEPFDDRADAEAALAAP
jgi:ketosteroid isomerase-like protein